MAPRGTPAGDYQSEELKGIAGTFLLVPAGVAAMLGFANGGAAAWSVAVALGAVAVVLLVRGWSSTLRTEGLEGDLKALAGPRLRANALVIMESVFPGWGGMLGAREWIPRVGRAATGHASDPVPPALAAAVSEAVARALNDGTLVAEGITLPVVADPSLMENRWDAGKREVPLRDAAGLPFAVHAWFAAGTGPWSDGNPRLWSGDVRLSLPGGVPVPPGPAELDLVTRLRGGDAAAVVAGDPFGVGSWGTTPPRRED